MAILQAGGGGNLPVVIGLAVVWVILLLAAHSLARARTIQQRSKRGSHQGFSMTSAGDHRSFVADGAKVLGGLALLAAGLDLTLHASKSDAVRWLVFNGFPVALVAALGARFPPRRLNVNLAASVAAGAAAIWTGAYFLRHYEGLSEWMLFTPLVAAFVSYFLFLAFLGPLHAAINVVGETRPPLWATFGCGLVGYLVGGGGLMGIFALTNPVGLDLAVFFLPLVTGLWGTAGALYLLSQFRRTGSLRG